VDDFSYDIGELRLEASGRVSVCRSWWGISRAALDGQPRAAVPTWASRKT